MRMRWYGQVLRKQHDKENNKNWKPGRTIPKGKPTKMRTADY